MTHTAPLYQLQAKNHGADDLEIELWELPSPATPHITKPVRIAGLRGRNLALVESQIFRNLSKAGIKINPEIGKEQTFEIDEEVSLTIRSSLSRSCTNAQC